jgi:hypothetical protein
VPAASFAQTELWEYLGSPEPRDARQVAEWLALTSEDIATLRTLTPEKIRAEFGWEFSAVEAERLARAPWRNFRLAV